MTQMRTMTHRQHTDHDVLLGTSYEKCQKTDGHRKPRQWTEGLFSVPRRARHKNAGTIHTFSTCCTPRAQKSEAEGRRQEPNVVCLQHQSIAPLPSAQAANSHLEKSKVVRLPHAISRWKTQSKARSAGQDRRQCTSAGLRVS